MSILLSHKHAHWFSNHFCLIPLLFTVILSKAKEQAYDDNHSLYAVNALLLALKLLQNFPLNPCMLKHFLKLFLDTYSKQFP